MKSSRRCGIDLLDLTQKGSPLRGGAGRPDSEGQFKMQFL